MVVAYFRVDMLLSYHKRMLLCDSKKTIVRCVMCFLKEKECLMCSLQKIKCYVILKKNYVHVHIL
jgi:hypothetical protein